MFKAIRISVLLLILAAVAMATWRSKTIAVQWRYTLPVNVYPINGDGSAVSDAYLRSLSVDDFKPIEAFMQEQALRLGRASHASIEMRLGKPIDYLPPAAPPNGNWLEVIVWSLNMRWWAYRHGETTGPGPQVKMFLLYFDPDKTARLDHSTALQKGLIGRVNVFAARAMARQNNIVITHEFLHTLGATDKYDRASDQPTFPDGYANPRLEPLLPQQFAEIMAGRTPLSRTTSEMPASLDKVLIGARTAQEINWIAARQ